MAESIPVDKLALMLGVDSTGMVADFMSASASTRAMSKALIDGMNKEFEKGNAEAAQRFSRMPQLAGMQLDAQVKDYKKFLAQMGTLLHQERVALKESMAQREQDLKQAAENEKRINEQRVSDLRAAIEARAVIERSASSVMIAGMSKVGGIDPMTAAMGAAYRQQQQAAKEAAEAAKLAQEQQLEATRATIIATTATDDQERAARRLAVAKRLQAKLDQDSARILAVESERKEESIALDEEAARVLRMIQSPQDAHAARVTRLNTLLATGRINQLQYNQAVKQSEQVMQASAAGMGKMTGVLAQLSFGMEDFIQGIAMGDLRSALLGASNNMTMVVRGLLDMKQGTTVAGMAFGKFVAVVAGATAVGGGLAYYLYWLTQAIRDTRSLTDALRDATMGFDRLEMTRNRVTAIERERIEIGRIKELDALARKEEDLAQRRIENERDLMAAQNKASVQANEIITQMMGGMDARLEVETLINEMIQSQNVEINQQGLELERALLKAQQGLVEGKGDVAINEMRKVFEFLDNETNIAIKRQIEELSKGRLRLLTIAEARGQFFDRTALNALEEYFQVSAFYAGESAEKLREIREKALSIAKDASAEEREAAQIKAAAIELELKRRELQDQRLAAMKEETILSQKQAEMQKREILFLITATDHQKELLRLKKESAAFGGGTQPNVPGLGFGGIGGAIAGIMNEAAFAMAAQDRRIEFLEAQRQQLQNELNALTQQPEVKPQGALEQNAFQAQADAFKQIMENANKQPNPQVTRIINLITSIDAAIKNGGVIKVVP